ncbi:MAG TPA: response regulator [Terriglobales bacterium]|nr:response regulator [Terriglobales bacterium]
MSRQPVILCVDDNSAGLSVRKQFLEYKGYAVFTAQDGPAGLEIARRETIDAVILDYKMPGMRGDEVAERLRRDHPELPIIVLSGFVGELPSSLVRMSYAQITKGDPIEALLDALERVTSTNAKRRPRSANLTHICEEVLRQSEQFLENCGRRRAAHRRA